LRRRGENITGSLDSLLDTMTNVVGILVILLVVTQLGVSTAVKRIRSNLPEVDEAVLEECRRETEAMRKRTAALETQWSAREAAFKEDSNRLFLLEKKADRGMAERHAELLRMLESLAARVEQAGRKELDLQAAVEKLKSEIELVRKELAALEKQEKPPEKVVRIPNPRPAPKDARGEWFVCREGRIDFVDVGGIAASVAKRLEMMKMQFRHGESGLIRRSAKTPAGGQPFEYDRAKVESYFAKNSIVVDGHRVHVYGRGHHPACWISLEFDMRRAEDESALLRPWSKVRKALASVRQRGNYARFIVYPDSFEIYLKAREIADDMKVPAGWQVNTEQKLATWTALPGILLNKTEPPPPPPPPPKEGEKPKVARPANVLD
jgi:hypothetical protein